jgi:hypothetical protein
LSIHHVGALHINTLDFGDETSDDAHQYQMLDFKSTTLLCLSEKGEGPPGKGFLRDSTLRSNLTRAAARNNKTWFMTPSGQSNASLLELDLPEGRIPKLKVISGHNHIKTTNGIGLRTDMYLITMRHFFLSGSCWRLHIVPLLCLNSSGVVLFDQARTLYKHLSTHRLHLCLCQKSRRRHFS